MTYIDVVDENIAAFADVQPVAERKSVTVVVACVEYAPAVIKSSVAQVVIAFVLGVVFSAAVLQLFQ